MKFVIVLFLIVGLISCETNSIDEKIQPIELSYVAWGCDCANWATLSDIKKYNDSGDTLASLCIYIEPTDNSIALPDTLGYNGDLIRFTGQFYKSKGFPKGYSSDQIPVKSRVFKYTTYEVINSNYKFTRNDKD